MTVEEVDKIYDILERYPNDYKVDIARGGYYALIKQGILSQSRPIGDIDMNILVVKPAADRAANSANSWIKHLVSTYNSEIPSRRSYITANFSSKRTLYGDYDDEIDAEEEDSELDSFSTLILNYFPRINNTTKVAQTANGWDLTAEARAFHMPNTITTSNTSATYQIIDIGGNNSQIFTAGARFSGSSEWAIPPKQPSPPKPTIQAVRDAICREVALEMEDVMSASCPVIKIDFFNLIVESLSNKVKFIDGKLYTSPYVILSAKHKYCGQHSMYDAGFNKHIGDLEESFAKIRIKGVNFPEDTNILRENRRLYYEQKKK